MNLEELLIKIQNRILELEARIKDLEDHPKEACSCTKCTG